MDDQNIWDKIVSGDVSALKILHLKYYYPMRLWAGKYICSNALAEELVSDCFIRLWERRKFIIIEKSIKSYLYLMLRNALVSQARKEKNIAFVGLENMPEVPDETEVRNQEYYVELYRAIQKLPDQRRKILELAAFDSLTYKEIADRLGISVNTVKTQMGRAYQFLKEELDPNNFVLFHLFIRSI